MIRSLLDNDLYKFTMMYAVWRTYRGKRVEYRFRNRRETDTFSEGTLDHIKEAIHGLGEINLTSEEIEYLHGLELFDKDFLDYLRSFKLDSSQVFVQGNGGKLELSVQGSWEETILWEVPLMAIISEVYFKHESKDWEKDEHQYFDKALTKGKVLSQAGCQFSDFGTRRRRSFQYQKLVNKAFCDEAVSTCIGTSNIYFAKKYGVRPIGTMAHEWIMAHAGLHDALEANKHAMETWKEVYGDNLLIALTDTYTTDVFLENFRGNLSNSYSGVRHDSESPFKFCDKIISYYESQGIDPATKTIVFSDSLSVEKAIQIKDHVRNRIKILFGIGTHFTNDFAGSQALNMVIKLHQIDNTPVVKLSDDVAKASGDIKAVSRVKLLIQNGR